MDIKQFYAIPGEWPLDNWKPDGGFTGIFRTIAFVDEAFPPVSLNPKSKTVPLLTTICTNIPGGSTSPGPPDLPPTIFPRAV